MSGEGRYHHYDHAKGDEHHSVHNRWLPCWLRPMYTESRFLRWWWWYHQNAQFIYAHSYNFWIQWLLSLFSFFVLDGMGCFRDTYALLMDCWLTRADALRSQLLPRSWMSRICIHDCLFQCHVGRLPHGDVASIWNRRDSREKQVLDTLEGSFSLDGKSAQPTQIHCFYL